MNESMEERLETAERLTNLIVGLQGFMHELASSLSDEERTLLSEATHNFTDALVRVSARVNVDVTS